MRNIYFGDFRQLVINHYKEIEAGKYEYQSTEWFLLRYLKRIEKNTLPPSIPGKVEGCMRGFVRFYVDNIDEKSETGERCIRIYNEYRKTLREGQAAAS